MSVDNSFKPLAGEFKYDYNTVETFIDIANAQISFNMFGNLKPIWEQQWQKEKNMANLVQSLLQRDEK